MFPMGAPGLDAPPELAPEPEEELSPADHLRAAIEHAQAALVDESDDADSGQLAKLIQGLYSILAGRQDAEDRAMGADPSRMRVLRRGA